MGSQLFHASAAAFAAFAALAGCKGSSPPPPSPSPAPSTVASVPASAASSSAPPPSRYHARDVKDGHHVIVSLTYTGKPRPTTFDLPAPYEAHCGTVHAASEALSVGGKGADGVNGAVVWLEGITEGAALPGDALTQDEKACSYSPHVFVGTVAQAIHLTNSDRGNHMVKVDFAGEPHLDDVTRVIGSGEGVILQPLPEWAGRIGRVTCPLHAWMSGWLLLFDHPYFAVTAAGVANMGRVPPGHYQLVVWHEGIDAPFDGKELHASDPASIRVPIDVGKTDVNLAFTLGDDGSISRSAPPK